MTTNQGFQNLLPHADTDAGWLFHAIAASRPVLHSLAAGSTFKEVSRESLRRLRLLVAPPREQPAISRVLDSIDDAIERAALAIAATESLRHALLHELLTRGLPGRHREWRDVTTLGAIPSCWKSVRLDEVLLDIEAGSAPRRLNRSAADDEWGVLRVGSITWGEYRPTENKALEPGIAPDPTVEVHVGDLLLSRANTPDLVGRTVLVRATPVRRLLSDKTLRLVPATDRTDQEFLHLVLSSATSRAQLSGAASGTSKSMFNISQANIRNIVVPLPPREEQQRITDVAAALRQRLEAERFALAAFRVFKNAASDGLLSGRVRVASLADWRFPCDG
jgi:type I restriction enzyme S subunit